MEKSKILSRLPYTEPFLFVDEILELDEDGITGTFTFSEKLDFYRGHFKENPVTPGVILTEAMAQIGLACFGIFLLKDDWNKRTTIALTSAETTFLKPVFPNEKVTVISEKIYFRFGKLKCKVRMENSEGKQVCHGIISGMITSKK